MGQFVSRDVIVSADVNPYRYVRSGPVNFTDPSGRGPCGQPVWDADLGRYVDPLYEQWAAEARARYGNAARGSPSGTESPWWAGTKAGLYAVFVSGPRNLGVGAFNAGREAVYYVRDVGAVGADAVVTGTGALVGKSWSLGVEEWSQVGRNNQPSNPNFWSDALTNAGRAGLAAGTLGTSEIAFGTYQYAKTGDADAFQQQMGGIAAGNLAGAATIKTGQTIRTTASSNTVARSALRQNVLANIAESQAARASSNFGVYVAREMQVLSGYNADAWNMVTLRAGSIVYGGVPGQSAFYTDFATVRASGLNAQSLFESTQVAPHPVYGYRPAVQAYRVTSELSVPGGSALNNPAFGTGGGTQFYLPNYNKVLVPIRQFSLSK